MKKVLSFVLVLAMILGSVSMVFAGKPASTVPAVWDDASFTDAPENGVATYLKAIGALTGYEDGTVKAENELTRAEAATLLVRAIGLDKLGKVQVKTAFKDVPATHWASGYVAVANQNGFADGVGNGNFDPDAKLTMDQAIAMILKVLGYQDKYLQGAWPTNVEVAAYGIGLLEKVNGQALEVGAQNATRQDFFNLLFNALSKNMVAWNKTFEQFVPVDALGQSISGIFGSTSGQKAITLVEKIGTKGAIITNSIVITDSSKKVPAKYLGKAVKFVQKTSLAGIWSVDSKTLEGTFDNKGTATFAGLALPTGADPYVFVNGLKTNKDYTDISTKSAVTAEVAYNTNGTLKTVYSFSLWEKNAVVKVTSAEAALLAAENYKKFTTGWLRYIAKTQDEETKVWSLSKTSPVVVEGAVDKLSDIKENDIVEIYCYGGDSDNGIAKVVVTRNVVTGTMSDYSWKNQKFTVNGVEYAKNINVDGQFKTYLNDETNDVLASAEQLEKALNVTSYSFYLDAAGKIAFAEYTTEKVVNNVRYAFVLQADVEEAYTEKTVVAGSVFKMVTDAYIRLLPLDTMVEESYHLVSTGALADAFEDTEDVKWNEAYTAAAIVTFTAVDGKLTALATASDIEKAEGTSAKPVKFNASGFVSEVDNKVALYAADAKAYVVSMGTDGDVPATSAACYAVKDAKDLAKATAEAIAYKYSAKTGLVEKVFVATYTSNAKNNVVTAAALVDLTGTKLVFRRVGSEATEELLVTGVALKTALQKATLTDLYEIESANGYVVTFGAIEPAEQLVEDDGDYATTELTYANGAFYNDAERSELGLAYILNPTFLLKDAKGYLVPVAEDELDAKLQKSATLTFYKAFQNDYYDVVVIDAPEVDIER